MCVCVHEYVGICVVIVGLIESIMLIMHNLTGVWFKVFITLHPILMHDDYYIVSRRGGNTCSSVVFRPDTTRQWVIRHEHEHETPISIFDS